MSDRKIAIAVRRLKPLSMSVESIDFRLKQQSTKESVESWMKENWLKRNHQAYYAKMLLNSPNDVVYNMMDAKQVTKETKFNGIPIEQVLDAYNMAYTKEWLH